MVHHVQTLQLPDISAIPHNGYHQWHGNKICTTLAYDQIEIIQNSQKNIYYSFEVGKMHYGSWYLWRPIRLHCVLTRWILAFLNIGNQYVFSVKVSFDLFTIIFYNSSENFFSSSPRTDFLSQCSSKHLSPITQLSPADPHNFSNILHKFLVLNVTCLLYTSRCV